MVKVVELDKSEKTLNEIAQVYKEVWEKNDNSIKERFRKHATYKGYRGYMIINEKNDLIGFAYGYTTLPGQYYNGLLRDTLEDKLADKWLSDCFELVELAVLSTERNKGYGKHLASKLVEGVTNKTAVLTTQMNNEIARNLYEKLNWEVVYKPFYPDKNNAFVIMGKKIN
ncbi:ribosomal protein S18 acetylase RimI-like enzyme [Salirhabdus euzebyi]|uniref:Ribosomal protein S18 acetylase RimI-like enzyme n=1 Tax=Salirhabdus euzebyi TaxID=394506 RepID=A0A841Q4C4_9BACI|nr:GNAT family N-acetyltransferase [Salirhabdus euzebyi]MBB6453248.1 ribosomal protein S18 acetylase RimI-like enzyme [Salirhabdus euzebyi]